jgi:hypothetical protein
MELMYRYGRKSLPGIAWLSAINALKRRRRRGREREGGPRQGGCRTP